METKYVCFKVLNRTLRKHYVNNNPIYALSRDK